MSTELINKLKENDEDFEWYPTTKEILKEIAIDLKKEGNSHFSILDIGAGNGQAFDVIYDLINVVDKYKQNSFSMTKYAIEKSKILISQMPDDVFVIGTDFLQQTLIDKKVDVVFCNPPYKEYVSWTKKIIDEANCGFIYLILPERWEKNKVILEAIKRRTNIGYVKRRKNKENDLGYEILGSFDFINSEFRESRAKIDIVKIKLTSYDCYRGNPITDPFNIWFDENFKIKADASSYESTYETNRVKRENLKNLVAGQNLIEMLEELYLKDMDNLISTYKSIENLDYALLKELNVNLEAVKEGLKLKIQGLKDLYWSELFGNLDAITTKLTSSSCRSMLGTLNENTHIDFSCDNVYAIVMWAIKNANKYFDSQLTQVYRDLTRPESVKNYKSNKRMVEDNWRFCKTDVTHYILDYRIVVPHYHCFNNDSYGDYDYPHGLSKSAHDVINDICVIGENLGFKITQSTYSFEWSPGQEKIFDCEHDSKEEIFMTVRAYKNGNLHFKFNQNFMTAFNIEASRINKWIKRPSDIEKETDISGTDICNHFGTNFKMKSIKLLT